MSHPEILRILEDIKKKKLFRFLRERSRVNKGRCTVDGKKVWLLCSNDYLGLSTHPEVISAFVDATVKYGAGSGASRLISGNASIHRQAEEKIAEFKGTDSALLFNSGYHANIGILQGLCERGDLVLSDELNHASIIDASRLSRAEIRVYRHNDSNHLEDLLREDKNRKRKKIIVTEAVFSMDGDIAPLKEIVELKEKFGAYLVVDEAHSTGILGEGGRGLCGEMNLTDRVDVQMATGGKALGVFGAFACASKEIIELLINRARSFIFTTALPPGVCGALIKSIEIAEKEKWRREKLLKNAKNLRKLLKDKGFNTLDSSSQIIPVLIGEEEKTMDVSSQLLKRGYFVQGIRPPTVPPGTSRLRVSLSSDIPEEVVQEFVEALKEVR